MGEGCGHSVGVAGRRARLGDVEVPVREGRHAGCVVPVGDEAVRLQELDLLGVERRAVLVEERLRTALVDVEEARPVELARAVAHPDLRAPRDPQVVEHADERARAVGRRVDVDEVHSRAGAREAGEGGAGPDRTSGASERIVVAVAVVSRQRGARQEAVLGRAVAVAVVVVVAVVGVVGFEERFVHRFIGPPVTPVMPAASIRRLKVAAMAAAATAAATAAADSAAAGSAADSAAGWELAAEARVAAATVGSADGAKGGGG